MAKKIKPEEDTVIVEILIRIDGSPSENRVTVFNLPIVSRVGYLGEEGVIRFQTKTLVEEMKKALDKLI